MRKFFLCFFVFILCGCQVQTNLKDDLDELLNTYVNDKHYYINHTNPYFNYYLPRQARILEANKTNNILLIDDNKVSMMLDIPSIIARTYYKQDIKTIDYKIAVEEYYVREDQIEDVNYTLKVYEIDEYYYIDLNINDFKFNSLTKSSYVDDIVKECLKIGINSSYDAKKVIHDFSNKGSVDYVKEQVDLFEVIVPKEGKLEDLINQVIDVKGEK